MSSKVCSFESCERRSVAHGLCGGHYQQQRRGVNLSPLLSVSKQVKVCSVDGCTRENFSLSMCNRHWQQVRAGKPVTLARGWNSAKERDASGRKQCRSCKDWFPESEFTIVRRNSDGLAYYCRRCTRDRHLKDTHNISSKQFEELASAQGGCCAICGDCDALLHVDHDHGCCPGKGSCGKCVRGLLCSSCNLGLGKLRDDVSRLRSAIAYLEKYGEA